MKSKVFVESLAKRQGINKAKKIRESLRAEDLVEAPVASDLEVKVANAIKVLKDIDNDVFYPALMIYERLGIENPSEKVIVAVRDICDDVDSVYDEDVRYTIEEVVDTIPEAERLAKSESVEEKLGEFKKGEPLGTRDGKQPKDKNLRKDFKY